MSYLHSLVLAKPSLHLQALRASGLDLGALFESHTNLASWAFNTRDEVSEPVLPSTANLTPSQVLGKLQFAELCLTDE